MYHAASFQRTAQSTVTPTIIAQAQARFSANITFLAKVLPELTQALLSCKTNQFSLFINDNAYLNLQDNKSGEALYAPDPYAESVAEVAEFVARPVAIAKYQKVSFGNKPLDEQAVVFVFGVGCGYHLKQLLLTNKLSALLIYEAELELLKHSLYVIDWQELFDIANQKNILLAIQPAHAVGDIKKHLNELNTAGLFEKKLYLYRHSYQYLTEEVIQFLITSSGQPELLLKGEGRFLGLRGTQDYLPMRPAAVLGNVIPDFAISQQHQDRFSSNIAKLKQFYPDIAEFYQHYQPKRWQFCIDNTGQDNIFHLPSRTFAYRDSEHDSAALATLFMQNPFRDTAIYSQSYQPKLEKYIHFKQIAATEALQKQLPKTELSTLPDMRTLAFFGCGLAKQITQILQEVTPSNIFIFEEDPDLFYASLYCTNWAELIEQTNAGQRHLYFNIGCAPESYLGYFLQQLYVVGAYEISNTFLFPCYFRPHLQKALAGLREQLRTFIALSEYYDNARFATTHFLHNAEVGATFYQHRASKNSYTCPVFIVGNGPSLDELIPYIQQYQHDAIIISCGTALKALYEYGITPDFHAEVEQNSATYNWITKVPDRQYLKQIQFLATAAAFPETVKLFKGANLSFVASHIPHRLLSKVDEQTADNFTQLQYAFPTVSNLALNMALRLGFQDIYLFGVDLGFVDIAHHHSKKSGYYTAQGEATYDYAKSMGRAIPVRGNFQPHVFTKFEFNMARNVMEQVIASHKNTSQVFNCSFGAYIEGAMPLMAENILIPTMPAGAKAKVLQALLAENFNTITQPTLINYRQYLAAQLPNVHDVITPWLSKLEGVATIYADLAQIQTQQAAMLKVLYLPQNYVARCLLEGSAYCYLGLMNAFADKLRDTDDMALFNQLIGVWRDYLVQVQADLANIAETPCPVAGLAG